MAGLRPFLTTNERPDPEPRQATWTADQLREYIRLLDAFTEEFRVAHGRPGDPLRHDNNTRTTADYFLRAAEQEEADRTARLLLQAHLTKQQATQLDQLKYFHVQGKHITYRIESGGHVWTDKPTKGSFCIQPITKDRLPGADVALAQLLLIQANEEQFLQTANWTPTRPELGTGLYKLALDGHAITETQYYVDHMNRQIPGYMQS